MRLKQRQKEALLAWISEGLQSNEINQRASIFMPPFKVSRAQVDYYRQSRGTKIEEIKEQAERSALKSGFALKERRVEALNSLAEMLHEDLTTGKGLWLDDVKMIGSGEFSERIEFESFNSNEVSTFRGVLDDIAKEVGDRRQKVDVKVNAREALAELLGVPLDELPATDNAHS
ncbi:MAG: hypothetical protein QOD00_1711 [Blastocatellia bacterium]|jgi:hypothetical protein|nr:hypothetical protein [Blastocatellia bacterium]